MGTSFEASPEDHLEQTPTAKIQRIHFSTPHPLPSFDDDVTTADLSANVAREPLSLVAGEPVAIEAPPVSPSFATEQTEAASSVVGIETAQAEASPDLAITGEANPAIRWAENPALVEEASPAVSEETNLAIAEDNSVIATELFVLPAQPQVVAPLPTKASKSASQNRKIQPRVLVAAVAALLIVTSIAVVSFSRRPASTARSTVVTQVSAYASSATISFAAVPIALTTPATFDIPAAGNTNFQPQTLQTGSYYVTTGPIQAQANGQNYIVPAQCGDPSTAVNTGKTFLQQQLDGQVTAGNLVLTQTVFTLDPTSITCEPAAGTKQKNPFTYTQTITGNASELVIVATAITTYQTQQLQALYADYMTQHPGAYAPLVPNVCATPTVTPSAQAGTVNCPANGTTQRHWDAAALQNIASQMKGLAHDDAVQFLAAQAGIAPDSISVITQPTNTKLPLDPAKMTITAP